MTRPALTVNFTKRAAREIEDAHRWWREHGPGKSDAIGEEIARAVNLVALQPGVGALARSKLRGIRRVLLLKIGYALYYRVRPRLRRIDVLAFWHTSRGSAPLP